MPKAGGKKIHKNSPGRGVKDGWITKLKRFPLAFDQKIPPARIKKAGARKLVSSLVSQIFDL